jgi:hypothetical protein
MFIIGCDFHSRFQSSGAYVDGLHSIAAKRGNENLAAAEIEVIEAPLNSLQGNRFRKRFRAMNAYLTGYGEITILKVHE